MKIVSNFLMCTILMTAVVLAAPQGAEAQDGLICAHTCGQVSTTGTNMFKCWSGEGPPCAHTLPGGIGCITCQEVTFLPESVQVGPDGFLLETPDVRALLAARVEEVGELIDSGRWVVRDPCTQAIIAQTAARNKHALSTQRASVVHLF